MAKKLVQEYLNEKAGTTGLSKQLALNVLAGITGVIMTAQDAANEYAGGPYGLSIQNALNLKIGETGLSTQDAASLL